MGRAQGSKRSMGKPTPTSRQQDGRVSVPCCSVCFAPVAGDKDHVQPMGDNRDGVCLCRRYPRSTHCHCRLGGRESPSGGSEAGSAGGGGLRGDAGTGATMRQAWWGGTDSTAAPLIATQRRPCEIRDIRLDGVGPSEQVRPKQIGTGTGGQDGWRWETTVTEGLRQQQEPKI